MNYFTKTSLAALALFAGIGIAQAQGMHEGHNMQPMQSGHPMQANTAQAASVEGSGVVKSIDIQRMRVTIAHEPIAALNWPAMVMPFTVADKALLTDLKVGDHVMFDLKDEQIITSIHVMPTK
ncbi:MAG: copper-binding protein [Saezia sp.]